MQGSLIDSIVHRELLSKAISPFFGPCRQRLLIVTDGGLDFSTGGFGLSRFISALLAHSPKPQITLAHRTLSNHSETIDGTLFPVLGNFNFDTAATAVTVANYDQIWMFGIKTGNPLPSPDPQPLTSAEIVRIATFMNAGGGVFSTGDHARLGQGMGGELPRIRHMREWSAVAMGLEGPVTGSNSYDPRTRIDTIVDPGQGPPGLFEFDDQSDSTPQRIYPNYSVKWNIGGSWTAGIHPLLSLGGPAIRTGDAGFTNDMDVLPDHPHESICLEVSTTSNSGLLNGTYNAHGLSFPEFPNAMGGTGKIGSEIVAFGVSGGRAIGSSGGKPPVYPRMFGLISAFDGHAAQPYSGAPTRPGRIVCDSTWHHYVNINLDGEDSFPRRYGLGTWNGTSWTPSAACNKIFEFYRRILRYLTPLNRQSCRIFIDLIALTFNPNLIEEIVMLPDLDDEEAITRLGAEAVRLMDGAYGRGTSVEAVRAALRLNDGLGGLADSAEEDLLEEPEGRGASNLVAYAFGKAIVTLRNALPLDEPARIRKTLDGKAHRAIERQVVETLGSAVAEALESQVRRAARRLERLQLRSRQPGCRVSG